MDGRELPSGSRPCLSRSCISTTDKDDRAARLRVFVSNPLPLVGYLVRRRGSGSWLRLRGRAELMCENAAIPVIIDAQHFRSPFFSIFPVFYFSVLRRSFFSFLFFFFLPRKGQGDDREGKSLELKPSSRNARQISNRIFRGTMRASEWGHPRRGLVGRQLRFGLPYGCVPSGRPVGGAV